MWLKLAVEVADDPKLLALPEAERWLWICLLCLAKRRESATLTGYTAKMLVQVFALTIKVPRAQAALEHFERQGMVRLYPDGTIEIAKWEERQAIAKDSPEAVRERQQAWRARERAKKEEAQRNGSDQGRSNGSVTGPLSVTERDGVTQTRRRGEETRGEEKNTLASAAAERPAVPPVASVPVVPIADLEADWPPDLVKRVREAVTSTRKGGTMAEGPWRAFLLSAKQYPKAQREAAASEYLDRAYAAEGKPEEYLLGMIRRGAGKTAPMQQQLGPRPVRPNAPVPASTREAHLLDAIEAERKKRGDALPTERETYLLEQLDAERKKRGAA
jgi:hypothetical protein